jgi:hypothetical protein
MLHPAFSNLNRLQAGEASTVRLQRSSAWRCLELAETARQARRRELPPPVALWPTRPAAAAAASRALLGPALASGSALRRHTRIASFEIYTATPSAAPSPQMRCVT